MSTTPWSDTAIAGDIERLERRRSDVRACAESLLLERRSAGITELSEGDAVRFRSMQAELQQIDDRLESARADLERMGSLPESLRRDESGRPLVSSAGRLAPLHVADEEMRRMQSAARRGESCRMPTRAFSTADSLLPSQLFPTPIEQQHDNRVLDKLVGYAMDSPQITFIRHISTTGEPGPVAEGAVKPELVFVTDQITRPAVKLAAHVGLSWEIISDWPAFNTYAGAELAREVVDEENDQLLNGDGLTGNMTGFYLTSGILTFDAATVTSTPGPWDALELAMAKLRVGPALATANLLVLNPLDWSEIRRQTNTMGDYYVASDPSTAEVLNAWGVPVLVTTQNPQGKGLLLDTTKLGYVAVRESMVMRIGATNDDFTKNIVRTVAEERLVLCVTRPAAVLAISNLPTTTA
jgi:HK97 family phage major capsid protein